jgi:hypothetical protein
LTGVWKIDFARLFPSSITVFDFCLPLDSMGNGDPSLFYWVPKGSTSCSCGTVLERPKSQSFTWQSRSIRMFAGLRSLCMTLALCKKLIAHKVLYIIVTTCYSLNLASEHDSSTFLRSESTYS